MSIRTDGYYISDGKHFEDWHAGHKDEGYLYSYLKLNSKGLFIKALYRNNDVNFLEEINLKTKEELLKDTSSPYGQYCIKENKIIQFKYRLMDKWDMSFELEIITPELLRDKDGREYHFVAVEDEKLEGLPG